MVQRCGVTLIFSARYLPLFARLFTFECASLFQWVAIITPIYISIRMHSSMYRANRCPKPFHICISIHTLPTMKWYDLAVGILRMVSNRVRYVNRKNVSGDDVRRSILFAPDSRNRRQWHSTQSNRNLFALVWFSMFIFDLFNVIVISNLFVQTKLVHVHRVAAICVRWLPCKFVVMGGEMVEHTRRLFWRAFGSDCAINGYK